MKRFNFLMGLLALVVMFAMLAACEAEQNEPATKTLDPVGKLEVTNFQGGSTATHTYDGGKLLVQIFLDKKVVLLDDKSKLGVANYVSGSVADTLFYVDSQKAWVYISYDKNVYQNVNVTFLGYDPATNGLTANITQQWGVSFGLVKVEGTFGSDPNLKDSYCRPWYIQSATEDDDIVIVKTDTTFTVTTTISSSSVTGKSTVKYPTVEVDKAQLGKVNITNETDPEVSTLPDGFVMAVGDKFSDSQIVSNVATCRHDDDARAWVEVTDIKYVTYYSTPGDGEATIKVKEVYSLEGRGKLSGKSWQVELYPSYRQVAKPTADNIIFNVVNSGTTSTGTGKTSISDSQISVTLKLAKASVEVDKAQLGKVSITKTTGPTLTNYSANGKSGKKGEQSWTLSDGQVINGNWQWLYAAAADNHLELTSLGTPAFTSKSLSDKEAEVTVKIPATVKMVGESASSKSVEFILVYKQVAKTTDDGITFTVTDGVGRSTGTGRTTISSSSLDVTITLGKTQIEVDANKLGVVNLSNAGSVSFSNISSGNQTGKKGTRNFTFSDTQTAAAVWQWLYATAAANHLELETIEFSKAEISNKTSTSCTVTLVFTGTVKTVGEVSKTKNVTFRPTYTQVVKEDVYTVTDRTWSQESGSSMLQYTEVTVFKNGDQISKKQFRSAACGVITGVTELYVSSTQVTKNDNVRDDTSPDWTGTSTSTDGVVTYEFAKNSKIHHYTRSFVSDAGGQVNAIDGEYRFMTSTITVKVNGKVVKTVTFSPSTTVTVDKLTQVSGVPSTKTASGHTYTYAGSWQLQIQNKINGSVFHISDCKPTLWKY